RDQETGVHRRERPLDRSPHLRSEDLWLPEGGLDPVHDPERNLRRDEVSAQLLEALMSEYRTIVADPPWDYEGFATAPTPIHGTAGPVKVAALPYESMTLEEIAALPLVGWCAKDCRLFLWTTNRYLPDAFKILGAWGFTYKQTLVWRKTGNPSPF